LVFVVLHFTPYRSVFETQMNISFLNLSLHF
jgi:hypothetical protein